MSGNVLYYMGYKMDEEVTKKKERKKSQNHQEHMKGLTVFSAALEAFSSKLYGGIRREARSSPVQSCSRVRASLLLSQPTHSLDTIAETPNAMRMSNSVFKETTTAEKRHNNR